MGNPGDSPGRRLLGTLCHFMSPTRAFCMCMQGASGRILMGVNIELRGFPLNQSVRVLSDPSPPGQLASPLPRNALPANSIILCVKSLSTTREYHIGERSCANTVPPHHRAVPSPSRLRPPLTHTHTQINTHTHTHTQITTHTHTHTHTHSHVDIQPN